MASKEKTAFVCDGCGHDQARWSGQCPTCLKWNVMMEFKPSSLPSKRNAASTASVKGGYAGTSGSSAKIDDVEFDAHEIIVTGIGELDRVMGGGITKKSVNILSGDPGSGKTTLLSKVAGVISKKMPVLYVTAEEATSAFKDRFKTRLKVEYNNTNFNLQSEYDVDAIIAEAIRLEVRFMVVDSIQALEGAEYTGSAGSISQVKGCAQTLNRFSKQNDVTMMIVSHVTKGSEVAGPNILRHIVDGTFHIETNDSAIRTIRPTKNRFGNVDTIGLFQMTEQGMMSVDNPSKIFLSNLKESTPGSAICCIRDGNRNLLLELQSLVTEAEGEFAQRVCVGLNMNRLKMITAILRKHGKLKFNHDVYVNLVGGLKLPESDTSADVSMAASLISSLKEVPLPKDMMWLGEMSLSGEIRPVSGGVPRVLEAIKHGFKRVVVPYTNYHKTMEQEGVEIIKVKTIQDVIKCIGV
jgi:DNA repair protein RadA/Sms